MPNLPSGTVTFLLTDVQDSTRLWEKYPADMRMALKRHDEIIESVSQQHHGFVVRPRGEGDSRFIVFERAIDGVSAAAAIQRALHTEPWPEQTPLCVRIGLHTGEGEFRDGDYYGTAVNRCARLRGIAHGGQTVISKTTYELAMETVSLADEYIDLGEHPLKGMQEPEHVFQLIGADLPSEFPPLKSPDDVEEPPAPGSPPFKGLQHFGETDAGLFFGREMLTNKIVARLRESISPEGDQGSFLALIVGASGSGKSSLVRAGLIPAIKESQNWPVHVITPGDHPLQALADSSGIDADTLIEEMLQDERGLHRAISNMMSRDDGDRMFLIVDHFEELFTLCRDENERRAFVDNLLTATSPEIASTVVVIVLRADFYGHCAQYTNLREALATNQEFIGPMNQKELQRAIEEPARQADWEFEPGLVGMLLQEVGDEPGALPLLSHALLETWKRRRGRVMTFTGYTESGGIRGAIAKTAERVHWRMSPEEQAITRNLFLRLTKLGEGTDEGGMPSPDTRRRVMLTELLPDIEEYFEARLTTEVVLQTLVDARLITTSEETAEVAHEALIREWPTLREWLNEDREGLLLHRHLTETAQEWQRLERAGSELYRGARLTQVLEWSWDHRDELNALEQEFLDASLADRRARQAAEAKRQAKEAALEQRSRRFLRALVSVFAVATAIAAILSIFAFNQQGIAQDNAATATIAQGQAQFQAATAVAAQGESQIQAATAVAAQEEAQVQANRADASAADAIEQKDIAEQEARAALESYSLSLAANAQQALDAKDPVTALMLAIAANQIEDPPEAARDIMQKAAFSPNAVRRYQPDDYLELGEAACVAFSPDVTTAIAGYENGSIILWDLDSSVEIYRFGDNGNRIHTAKVSDVAFIPDGSIAVSGADDGTLVLWDVNTGRSIRQLAGHKGQVYSIAISPDGTKLASGGFTGDYNSGISGELILWDLATGDVIHQLDGYAEKGISGVEFSPDGERLITQIAGKLQPGKDVVLMIWDVETGELIRDFSISNTHLLGFAMSPDGKTALLGDKQAGHIIHVDLEMGEQIQELTVDSMGADAVTYSPDGRHAVSGDTDGNVIVWDLQNGEILQNFSSNSGRITQVNISPDGKFLLSAAIDGSLIIWDLYPAGELQRFWGHDGFLGTMEVTPDGKQLLSAAYTFAHEEDQVIRIWDIETGINTHVLQHEATLWSFDISPDGRYVLAPAWDFTITLWDLHTREKIRVYDGLKLGHTNSIGKISFTPDGRSAINCGLDGKFILWDLESGETIYEMVGHNRWVRDAVFIHDGKKVITSGDDGIILWDLESGEHIRRFLGQDYVIPIDISPDGKKLLSLGPIDEEQGIFLWDIATGQVIQRIMDDRLGGWDIHFHPNGRHAIAAAEWGIVVADLEKGEIVRRYIGNDSVVIRAIAVSPDGRTLYSGDEIGTIIQWQMETLTLDELFGWAAENRYIRQPTCEERALYQIQPLCEIVEAEISTETSDALVESIASSIPRPIHIAELGENIGELILGDFDIWHYEGVAGEILTIHVLADNPADNTPLYQHFEMGVLDMYLIVISPSRSRLAQNDNADTTEFTTNSHIEDLILPVDGTYRIEVHSSGGRTEGGYTLLIESSPPTTPETSSP